MITVMQFSLYLEKYQSLEDQVGCAPAVFKFWLEEPNLQASDSVHSFGQ